MQNFASFSASKENKALFRSYVSAPAHSHGIRDTLLDSLPLVDIVATPFFARNRHSNKFPQILEFRLSRRAARLIALSQTQHATRSSTSAGNDEFDK